MTIYDLARQLLEMYEESERLSIIDSSMPTQKYERKMKALMKEVEDLYAQIKKLEEADHAQRDPDYHQ